MPAVKALEYVGLENFYSFLQNDLGLTPVQPLQNYQLGIALGALEMNLLDLARYFSLFPNQGVLRDLQLLQVTQLESCRKAGRTRLTPGLQNFEESCDSEDGTIPPLSVGHLIAEPPYVQLVNKILSDRKTGMEQFGMKSDLNLFQNNYALKTGTSRDFKDSWVIGFTPDFLAGVWVGNADSSPTLELSGQKGAGKIWSQVMELLLNSPYNKKTPFAFDKIKEFKYGDTLEYGLVGDDYEKYKNLLIEQDSSLILAPQDGDRFLWEANTRIILKAKEEARWFVDNVFLGQGQNIIFSPPGPGTYHLQARLASQEQSLTIFIASSP